MLRLQKRAPACALRVRWPAGTGRRLPAPSFAKADLRERLATDATRGARLLNDDVDEPSPLIMAVAALTAELKHNGTPAYE